MTSPSIDELRDIHLPAPPLVALTEWEGWWLLTVALLILAVILGCWVRRHAGRRRLRAAQRELARLAASHARDGDATQFTRGLSQLLRRYAQTCFPAAGVEGLSGADWLSFLDAHGGAGEFATGAGAVLEWRPYRGQGEIDAAPLIALVRRWLQANPQ